MGAPDALLDAYMPAFEVRTRYVTRVRAPAAATFRALRAADLTAPWVVRLLLWIRVLPARLMGMRPRPPRPRTVGDLARSGGLLAEEADHEIVFGLIGTFWALRRSSSRPVERATFASFAEPGFAKAVLSFAVDPIDATTSVLSTETRVLCTDAMSRARFRPYWAVIGPFSGLIRRVWLAAVRDEAERAIHGGPSAARSAIRSPGVTPESEDAARGG